MGFLNKKCFSKEWINFKHKEQKADPVLIEKVIYNSVKSQHSTFLEGETGKQGETEKFL